MARRQASVATPPLYEIRLPAGDHVGFDVDYWSGTGRTKLRSSDWLSQGYAGVRFIGEGPGKTHIRAVGDQAFLIDRHAGLVSMEGLTIHCGRRQGIWFGLEHKASPTLPEFKLKMRGCEVVADAPPAGTSISTVWGVFSYQADLDLEDVVFWMERSAEHASYAHGFSKEGLRWKRVRVEASGAEGCKVRNSPSETRWVKDASIVIQDCSFKAWNQPWSWRGGAGVVLQGSGCNLLVERSVFWGRAPGNSHSRCLMVDDSSGDFYSANDGRVGVGPANGHIIIRDCGFTGGPGPEWYAPLVRIGSLGSGQPVARSLLIERSALYGDHEFLQLSDIPSGKMTVRGCNTPTIRDFAAAKGFDVTAPALLAAPSGVRPIEGGILA